MNVAIIGFGIEGKAAHKYWSDLGAQITICDQNPDINIPANVSSQLGDSYLDNLDRFDTIFRSAGINPEIILSANPTVTDRVTTTMNEFLRVCPTKHAIGVTGTKGKGTTSTLIAKMLEAAGKDVHLGGNIGISPFEFLSKLTDKSWVVLELSSFQLTDLKYSPSIAVCLMVVPEHLNWHRDMDDYILSKARLFEHQTTSDLAIYYGHNDISRKVAGYSPGFKIPYFIKPGAYIDTDSIVITGQRICDVSELKLLGEHNWQNACAAVTTVWQITQNVKAIRSVLTTFSGLEHRLEFVREVGGIKYYNDSFAATPDAAIAALEAIKTPKVLIAGGFDRNLPLGHLAKAISIHQEDLRKVVLIGASGPRLAHELDVIDFSNYTVEPATHMPTIVKSAKSFARSGDAILLSPGFASFDMFKNFVDRGLQFKDVVEKLQ